MSQPASSNPSATCNIRPQGRERAGEPAGPPPPPAGPERDACLAQMRAEQRRRWRAGEHPAVEALLQEMAWLIADEGAVLELVFGEYAVREELGERPTQEEYQQRFPALAQQLQQQVRLHRALRRPVREQRSPWADGPATIHAPGASSSVVVVLQGHEDLTAEPDVAGYEILGPLGRGGMGLVLKARHRALNRVVALKMILSARFAGEEELLRFKLEGELAASLQHPNIVQVYEVGTHQGQPFMALEYVEGGTLADYLDVKTLNPRESAHLVETLARAVQAAHQRGIIHRDLKPANVLLSFCGGSPNRAEPPPAPLGERPLNEGVPKIADFGLAKQLDRVGGLTETGRILGTPQYMAPEQAAGRGHEVGPATDIYALGAILYELLAGRPPFDSSAGVDTVMQVLLRDPVPPRKLCGSVPRDLEIICLKCLEKEPGKRYASAEKLADDLRAYLEDRPIEARPVRAPERAWKWARRRPVIAGLVLGLVLVAVAGFAGVTAALVYALEGWQQASDQRIAAEAQRAKTEEALEETKEERQRADRERRQADRERQQAEREREVAQTSVFFNNLALIRLRWQLNNLATSGRLLQACQPDRRGWAWHYLRGLHHGDLMTIDSPHTVCARSVAYSPDGKYLATGGGTPYQSPKSAEVCVWDAASGKLLRTLGGFKNMPTRVVYSADGKYLAASSFDHRVRVWRAAGGQLVHSLVGNEGFGDVAFSPDGKYVAGACSRGGARMWEMANGREVRRFHRNAGVIPRLAFSPDGKHLATSANWEVRIWEVGTGKPVQRFAGGGGGGLAYSPDGRWLAVGHEALVRVYDISAGRLLQAFSGHEGRVAGVAFSPDGRFVVSGGADSTVRLWNVQTGNPQMVWRGHLERVEGVCFHPDGWRVVSVGSQSAALKIWDLTRHPEYARAAEHRPGRWVEGFGFDAEQNVVLQRSGGEVEVRDPATGRLRRKHWLPLSSAWVVPARLGAFSGDGKRLTAVRREGLGDVQTWAVQTGKPVGAVRGFPGMVQWLASSADGRRVAGSSIGRHGERLVSAWAVWDPVSGQTLLERRSGDEVTFGLCLSRDGHYLAQALKRVRLRVDPNGVLLVMPSEQRVRVWAVPARRARARVPVMDVEVPRTSSFGLAFSPDGKTLAGCVTQEWVHLWAVPSGKPILRRPLLAPPGMTDMAFSPDGRLLAAVNRKQVKVWDVKAGQEVLELKGAKPRPDDGGFNPRIAWSPDGKRLAATNWTHSVSVWEAADLEPVRAKAQLLRAAQARSLRWHLEGAVARFDQGAASGLAFHRRRLDARTNLDVEEALERGDLYARLGLWPQAGRDYQRAFRLADPDDVKPYRSHASLRLRLGDRAGYRAVCRRMLARFGATSKEYRAANVAAACLQTPDTVADWKPVLRLARLAAEGKPKAAWHQQVLALAYLRSGRTDLALQHARRSLALEPDRHIHHPLCWLVLALAEERTGQVKEADAWRKKAEKAIAELARTAARTPCGGGPRGLAWWEWVSMQVLLEEARKAVGRRDSL